MNPFANFMLTSGVVALPSLGTAVFMQAVHTAPWSLDGILGPFGLLVALLFISWQLWKHLKAEQKSKEELRDKYEAAILDQLEQERTRRESAENKLNNPGGGG